MAELLKPRIASGMESFSYASADASTLSASRPGRGGSGPPHSLFRRAAPVDRIADGRERAFPRDRRCAGSGGERSTIRYLLAPDAEGAPFPRVNR